MGQMYGKTNRTRPSSVADSTQVELRMSRHGEPIVVNAGGDLNAYADEGSFFGAIDSAAMTAAAYGQTSQATYAVANPTFLLCNAENSNTNKRYYLNTAKLVWVTAPTGCTNFQCLVLVQATNPYSAGGATMVKYNVNYDDTSGTNAVAYYGAMTGVSLTSPRYLYKGNISSAIPAVGDTYTITFGQNNVMTSNQKGCNFGPCVLGPGNQTMLIYYWGTAQSGAGTCNAELTWWER